MYFIRQIRRSWYKSGDSGIVLIQVLILTMLLNLVAFTLVSVSLRAVEIEQLHHFQRQAYWLARSEALQVISDLGKGKVVESQAVWVDSGSTVTVTVSTQTPWTVIVRAVTDHATNAVHFTFDQMSKSVTSWVDSGT
ncbi:hypothetical protein [Alicyclobacillus ferrooxydans]|uniref:Uncharacterized protein n=1 Tax=Alicyclobacillus ferrooxydans TaxID=471514 RepID=A0A0P9EW13_9BACL|nr:hypothetical protein [Alicyclobacillus ferrooxydans]KPV43244.1 hypothetical protein AN477_13410 [Alicyclobacillus ferrooxydans]